MTSLSDILADLVSDVDAVFLFAAAIAAGPGRTVCPGCTARLCHTARGIRR